MKPSKHEIIQSIVADINTTDSGNRGAALTQLSTEGNRMLQHLRNQIMRAHEQVQTRLRQVFLYITTDGKTPRYALLIDDINDVTSYSDSEFHSSSQGATAN